MAYITLHEPPWPCLSLCTFVSAIWPASNESGGSKSNAVAEELLSVTSNRYCWNFQSHYCAPHFLRLGSRAFIILSLSWGVSVFWSSVLKSWTRLTCWYGNMHRTVVELSGRVCRNRLWGISSPRGYTYLVYKSSSVWTGKTSNRLVLHVSNSP